MEHTCNCCSPEKSYTERRNLRKHQRKYDPSFIEDGVWSSAAKLRRKAEYEKSPRSCLCCSTVFSYEDVYGNRRKKFCNSVCAAKVTKNRKRLRRLDCVVCSNQLGKNAHLYCSYQCNKFHQTQTYINDWLSGKNNGSQSSGLISKKVRDYMLERANYACEECGWSKINPVTGNVPVQVDHIDGNSTNQKVTNLRVLCPSCHSLTPTFGALNKGNGRDSRREARQRKNASVVQ